MSTAMESVLALQQGLAASGLVGKTAQYTLSDGTTGSGVVRLGQLRRGVPGRAHCPDR